MTRVFGVLLPRLLNDSDYSIAETSSIIITKLFIVKLSWISGTDIGDE